MAEKPSDLGPDRVYTLFGEVPRLEARTVERKLAAIFAADVEGYSRLMGQNEVGTLRTLNRYRAIIDPLIASHRGRIFTTAGDSLVADFASAVDAVECAVAVQGAIAKENADRPAGEQMRFRIGIHVGDIIVQGDNLFGDGVNIAARLESLAEPGAICVSSTVLDQIGTKLPYAFTDLGEQQVKNIAQPIRVYRVRSDTSPTAAPVSGSSLSLPDKPSIAVLPFQNMSGDSEQEYFADGMVEEIITALSRIKWLFVIARNSSFTYKGQAVDVKQVGRELGVRYVLEGSVRKAGQRVRITAQLIEAETGTHLWANRFDGSLKDIFELQDKVASSVAGVIEPALQAAEIRLSSNRLTVDLTAYDLYLRALPHTSAGGRESTLAALDLLRQAIERDPSYGRALATAAFCHYWIDLNGWAEDRETNSRKAVAFAQQAVRTAAGDSNALAGAARVLAYFGEDIHVAIGIIDRSLALNPNSAEGWFTSGWLRLYAGETSLAIKHFETSARLDPNAEARTLHGIGQAHFFDRKFDDALEKLLIARHAIPIHATTYRFPASCYAHMGRLDEAREIVTRLRVVTPVVVPSATPYRNAEQRELFLSGLRLAAGETE
jgi:adenylate cyclase